MSGWDGRSKPPVAKRIKHKPRKPGRYWRFDGGDILDAVMEAADRGEGVWFHLSGRTLTLQLLERPSIEGKEQTP